MRHNRDEYGHELSAPKHEAMREWLNEKCASGEVFKSKPKETAMDELNGDDVREYVEKWHELVRVGDAIRKRIKTPPIVVALGGKHFSLSPVSCGYRYEPPLRVEEVQVLE